MFLEFYRELDDESIEFVVAAGRAVGPPEDVVVAEGAVIEGCTRIELTPDAPRWAIRFDSYVAFSIRDESFAQIGDGAEYEGKFLRRYSASAFLDYMKVGVAEYATDVVGAYSHWGFACLNHVVDVASVDAPQLSRQAT